METLEFWDQTLSITAASEDHELPLIHHGVIRCYDLVSVVAIYHKNCFAKFSLQKHDKVENMKMSRGRPADDYGKIIWEHVYIA